MGGADPLRIAELFFAGSVLLVSAAALGVSIVQGCSNSRAIENEAADRRAELELVRRQVEGQLTPVVHPAPLAGLPIYTEPRGSRPGSVRLAIRNVSDAVALNGTVFIARTRLRETERVVPPEGPTLPRDTGSEDDPFLLRFTSPEYGAAAFSALRPGETLSLTVVLSEQEFGPPGSVPADREVWRVVVDYADVTGGYRRTVWDWDELEPGAPATNIHPGAVGFFQD